MDVRDLRFARMGRHLAVAILLLVIANIAARESQVQQMIQKLAEHAESKEGIIQELDAKQKELAAFKETIESLSLSTQRTLNDMTGGWKATMEQGAQHKCQGMWRIGLPQ